MMYLFIKWLHIISATMLFGAGVGSAFYVFMANRIGDKAAIRFATRMVVLADWLFTTPAIILQFVTGLILISLGGWSFGEYWLKMALTLFVFAGMCWLPVVWIQIKMRALAEKAHCDDEELPSLYWRYERWWVILGSLAFPAVLIIFYLMVFKPG